MVSLLRASPLDSKALEDLDDKGRDKNVRDLGEICHSLVAKIRALPQKMLEADQILGRSSLDIIKETMHKESFEKDRKGQ